MSDQKNKQQQQQQPTTNQPPVGGQQPIGSDIENPDMGNDPGQTVSIDDDPETTKKKVPSMG